MLPDVLHAYPALYKLIWLYVLHGAGELRVGDLVQALGVSFPKATTALRYMVRTGAIIEIRPRAGRTPGQYRAAQGKELGCVQAYETQLTRRENAVP